MLSALDREPVDSLPCHDTLWQETVEKYTDEGTLKENEDVVAHYRR